MKDHPFIEVDYAELERKTLAAMTHPRLTSLGTGRSSDRRVAIYGIDQHDKPVRGEMMLDLPKKDKEV